ncbi:hypothetical protein K445DRAFT_18281 [Daldinia sp. EC12]|nr:hypothetical protein K445DRAFT_18281 [Daldinia sp. EC12]
MKDPAANIPLGENELKSSLETILATLQERNKEVIDCSPSGPDDLAPGLSDPLGDIQVLIDCLMELSLAIDDFQKDSNESSHSGSFPEIDPAWNGASTYYQEIHERFPSVPHWLVERLSKAYSAISEKLQRAELEIPEKASMLFQRKGDSIERPNMINRKALKIPAIPKAAQGGTFTCMVCLRAMDNDINPTEWNEDISVISFNNPREWRHHEKLHHTSTWSIYYPCPFCVDKVIFRNVDMHLEHIFDHLKAISEASVPIIDEDCIEQKNEFWSPPESLVGSSVQTEEASSSSSVDMPWCLQPYSVLDFGTIYSKINGPILPCEMSALGCQMVFSRDEIEAWVDHIVVEHLHDRVPKKLGCWFCDLLFDACAAPSGGDRLFNFNIRMAHICDHFMEGKTVHDIRADFHMVAHLSSLGLMPRTHADSLRRWHDNPGPRRQWSERIVPVIVDKGREDRRRKDVNNKPR